MTSPIRPDDVVKVVPEEVIQVFNELISEAWDGHRAVIKQEDALARIVGRLDVSRAHVFEKRWLDVESLFRTEGWKVTYDKPAYCENYPATFEFRKAKP